MIVALVLVACDAPTGPYEGEGGSGDDDWFRRMMCEEAEDRMHNPAKYDLEDPMLAEMIGRDMYNEWRCDELESEVSS